MAPNSNSNAQMYDFLPKKHLKRFVLRTQNYSRIIEQKSLLENILPSKNTPIPSHYIGGELVSLLWVIMIPMTPASIILYNQSIVVFVNYIPTSMNISDR